MRITVYVFDPVQNKFIRLLVVESKGLAELLIPTLRDVYKSLGAFAWMNGANGPAIIPGNNRGKLNIFR